ncbi:conserved Plasmodium protein, unknown function [Plasmodium ovale]|uniref:ubiquitinyl hydrolase 1 n=1 Tax=Plasmodium ovale TaxID=36330 RepID=A0A1C3KSE9_PLAOA|nr:conserved Plasmodium protein, unknown function [Plasmodium ovale]
MCQYETHVIETDKGPINVYFEKQSKLYCLVHTANNILQAHMFSPDDFKKYESNLDYSTLEKQKFVRNNDTVDDQSSKELMDVREKDKLSYENIFSYIKRGIYYFGNFNINILYFFMNKYNMELNWVDNKEIFQKINKEKCTTLFDDKYLNNKKLIAFVINVVKIKFFDIYHHRHFYALRKISGMWFKLDSSLDKPILFPTNEEINKYLINIVKDNKFSKSDNYIIQVFKKESDNSK